MPGSAALAKSLVDVGRVRINLEVAFRCACQSLRRESAHVLARGTTVHAIRHRYLSSSHV